MLLRNGNEAIYRLEPFIAQSKLKRAKLTNRKFQYIPFGVLTNTCIYACILKVY